jgi:hypothetical protein
MTMPFKVFYVEENQFLDFRRDKKSLNCNYEPFTKFEPMQYFTPYSLRVKVMEKEYDSTTGMHLPWDYLKFSERKWFFKDFRDGKNIYFTNDGATIYQVIRMQVDEMKTVELDLAVVFPLNYSLN